MPTDLQLKTMNLVHKIILKGSFGKLGWGVMGMPVVELKTIGRKSGQERVTMLTSPLVVGDKTIIVASRGGDDKSPAWFLNLQANPEVTARIGGAEPRKFNARITEGEERKELWTKLAAAHDNYAGYAKNTSREIPVVVLEPK